MKITPLEIRQKAFEKVLRGYDKDEVIAFLQTLSQEWERMLDGVTETSVSNNTGGLVAPQGCITGPTGTAGVYTVSIAWRGTTPMNNPATVTCGLGSRLYGASDEYRRVINIEFYISNDGLLLRLLLVELEIVDHLRQPGARQDLHRHQVQAIHHVRLLLAGLDELLRDALRLDQDGRVDAVLGLQDGGHEDRREEDRARDSDHEPEPAPDDPMAESRSYEAAFNLFKSGNYAGAITDFKSFLKAYPDSTLAPNAQYWTGYAYYARKDYKNALAQQMKLVSSYPQSPKVPDALLNIASNQVELKDLASTRKNLEEIIAKYPGTNAAAIASKRLNLLK